GALMGLDEFPPQFHVPIPRESEACITAKLAELGMAGTPLAVLVPGTIWETKHWQADGFAEVGRYLIRTGRAVVLAGSPAERPLCSLIAAQCPGAANLAGQTRLSELAALIRRAAICVTNDSGSMHLAVALGRPVISV